LQIQSLTKYAKYIKEKANHQLFEDDFGFITFEVTNCIIHIHDLWVDPDYRHKGHGSKLIEEVLKANKTEEIKYLSSSVQLNANYVTETLKAQLHYGFSVVGANENEIKLLKEL